VVVVSDSANASEAPTGVNSSPRALIHKKILETAASMPEATMAEVAEEVSGASTDLVERVLDEYGDPAASADSDPALATDGDQPTDTASSTGVPESTDDGSDPDASEEQSSVPSDAPATPDERGAETASDETPVTDPDELTEKERAVLEVVAERPGATQQAVADVLGVSRATVSKRASGIEGFDWSERASFVERLFGTARASEPLVRGNTDAPTVPRSNLASTARADGDTPSPPDAGRPSAGGERTADREDVLARLDRIEARLDDLASGEAAESSGGITDPELAHKVVHACMESEHVSEDEELDVVAAVLQGDAPA
jgi:transcriptional regulator with XRE-family HTH domain